MVVGGGGGGEGWPEMDDKAWKSLDVRKHQSGRAAASSIALPIAAGQSDRRVAGHLRGQRGLAAGLHGRHDGPHCGLRLEPLPWHARMCVRRPWRRSTDDSGRWVAGAANGSIPIRIRASGGCVSDIMRRRREEETPRMGVWIENILLRNVAAAQK